MHHSLITHEMTMIRSVFVVCLLAGLLISIAPAHAQKRGPKSSTPVGVGKDHRHAEPRKWKPQPQQPGIGL